jgi:hypothetical protein
MKRRILCISCVLLFWRILKLRKSTKYIFYRNSRMTFINLRSEYCWRKTKLRVFISTGNESKNCKEVSENSKLCQSSCESTCLYHRLTHTHTHTHTHTGTVTWSSYDHGYRNYVLWSMTPCTLVEAYKHLGWTRCLHVQDRETLRQEVAPKAWPLSTKRRDLTSKGMYCP